MLGRKLVLIRCEIKKDMLNILSALEQERAKHEFLEDYQFIVATETIKIYDAGEFLKEPETLVKTLKQSLQT